MATQGFKQLTSSTTISHTPVSNTIQNASATNKSISNPLIATTTTSDKQPLPQPLPLQRALFDQASFRRPSDMATISSQPLQQHQHQPNHYQQQQQTAPLALTTLPSPGETFLSAPTPSSSIASSQTSLAGQMYYPNFSGVDKLIIAAQIEASSQNAMSGVPHTALSNPQASFQALYNDPVPASTYLPSAINLAYYQHQLQQQQQQQQQQQYLQQKLARDTFMPQMALAPGDESQCLNSASRTHNQVNSQPTPKNKHELELYELLRQANLLEYFSRFIKFGGDDVQQLADADEQEFVEIMELVQMNHKPLHMRRMQKALNQWRLEKDDAQEAGENFRKPEALYDSGFYFNPNAQDRHNTSLRSTSSLNDSFVAPSSITRASRSLFPKPNENLHDKFGNRNNVVESPQQYTPLEVIKNAPKKPRLMDSIVPSDLTKGIQLNDTPLRSTPKKRRHTKHFKRSASSPASVCDDADGTEATNLAAEYSPPESPASMNSSSDSDESTDSEPIIEVQAPDQKVTGTRKRKRGLRKPSVADLRKYYGLVDSHDNTKNTTTGANSVEKASEPANK